MKKQLAHKIVLIGTWLVAVNATSCVTEVETIEVPDHATLIEDSRIMGEIFNARPDKTERSMHIDLTDDRQYRFVRNRLLASGKTPQNSPHLFELVEQGHEGKTSAINAAPETATIDSDKESAGQTQSITATTWCGHFLLLEEKVNNADTQFTPSAIMSCFDGTSYSYLDGAVYRKEDQSGNAYTFLKSNSANDYGNGRNLLVELGPTLFGAIDDADKMLRFESMAIAEKNNISHVTYALVETMGPGGQIPGVPHPICPSCFITVPSLKVEHPKKIINSKSDPNYYDFFNGTNIKGKNPYAIRPYSWYPDYEGLTIGGTPYGDRVRVCLERGYAAQLYGQIDCDYATVSDVNGQLLPFMTPYTGIAAMSPTLSMDGALRMDSQAYWPVPKYEYNHRYVPIKGSFEMFYPGNGACTIDSFDETNTQAQLVLYEDGGFCQAGKSGASIGTSLAQAMQVDPNGLRSTFNMLGDFGGDCYWSANSKRSHFYAMVYAKTKGAPNCGARFTTRKVTPLDFLKTCFAEGTEIRRTDGKLMPVEQFHTGDKVIANGNGLALTVTGVVTGTERNDLINLYDNHGHDLFVTEMHPIVTVHKGVVKAIDLKEGDEVMTESGPAILTAVQRVAYDRPVYNLSLGTTEELARAGKENRTMFAEGYLVGDNEMQIDVETAPKPRPAKIASVWERDYQFDKAKAAKTGR